MKSKLVVVVGGTRGIGHGFVANYLAEGCKVIATHRPNSNLTRLKKEQEQYGDQLILAPLDLTSPSQIKEFTNNLNTSDEKIDLLILSAGTTGNEAVPLLEAKPLDPQTFESEYDLSAQVHVKGPLSLIMGLKDKLQNANSCIVYLTTPHALGSKVDGCDVYAMTKAAGQMMIYHRCKEMSKDWSSTYRNEPEKLAQAPGAIAISPGWVQTDMGGQKAKLTVSDSVNKMAAVIDTAIKTKKFNAVYSYDGSTLGTYMASNDLAKVIAAAENQQTKADIKPSTFSIFNKKRTETTHSEYAKPLSQI